MTRKNKDFTRDVLPDPKYGDLVVARTINVLMRSGKKSVAERAMYAALDRIEEKTKQDAVEMFHKAINNIRPSVEVRSRRVGGATYQVPTEVSPTRAQALALRWLKSAANSRGERTLSARLANEILEALENRGSAVKKREDTHKMAEANKAFSHFRW